MPKSPLSNERKLFKEKKRNLLDCFLNFVFKLDKQGAQNRSYLSLIFVSSLILIWLLVETKILFGNMTMETVDKNSFLVAILRLIPLFVFPYLIAIESATDYLSDIFELKDRAIAQTFIYQAAFASKYGKITIKDGVVIESDQKSPILLIGGPGKVVVDLHSVALFERADGTPHIIGPTVDAKSKENILDGFERLRETMDLRDILVGPKNISERTQDGIKINAEDVRMSFSINRNISSDAKKMGLKKFYPFSRDAVLNLIYGQSCQVSSNQNKQASCSRWETAMGAKFSGELKTFIRKHTLSQFISTEGEPEIKAFDARKEGFEEIKDATILSENEARESTSGEEENSFDFQTRDKISRLFSKFARSSMNEIADSNVTLNWIGIGTWKPPRDIIPKRHLEAWKLSKENAKEGSEKNLNNLEDKEKHQEFLRQIRKVPLASSKLKGAPNLYYKYTIEKTLVDYRELIKTAYPYIKKYSDENEKENTARIFRQAIKIIDNSLKGLWL